MDDIIVAYIPVIHRGYLDYLASTGAKTIYLLQAKHLKASAPQLAREIRALTLEELICSLQGFGYKVHSFDELHGFEIPKGVKVYMPEDDATKDLIIDAEIVRGSWFLRWDWKNSTTTGVVQPEADRVLKKGDTNYYLCSKRMKMLLTEAKRSSDWWRQVAAWAVTVDGVCIIAYNKHYPHEHIAYMDGDPRDNFNPGEFIEISVSFHAEQGVIAEAARRGISLQGAELLVVVFPCNQCAPPVLAAGFKKVYFSGGYSNLYGQKTLREGGVELIYVEL